MKPDKLPYTSNELINLNIERLKHRAKKVFTERNFYYDNPVWEKTEILQWIGKLEKLIK